MPFERLFTLVDRMVGGRTWRVRVPAERFADARVRRTWVAVMAIIALSFLVGAAALVIAIVSWLGGASEPIMVWIRGIVVLGLTAGLGYFSVRALQRYRWAYARMLIFPFVFPAITLVLVSIPGLYPTWMIIEQIVFAGLMIVIGILLLLPWMRAAYRRDRGTRAES